MQYKSHSRLKLYEFSFIISGPHTHTLGKHSDNRQITLFHINVKLHFTLILLSYISFR